MKQATLFVWAFFCALVVVMLPMKAALAKMPEKFGPQLETVKTFDNFHLVGIAVSHNGRIFASAPANKTGYKLIEINAKSGAVKPYPDQNWNSSSGINAQHEWSVPQALWVDRANHLWVLDSGVVTISSESHGVPPKLVEFDLANNKVIRIYGFGGVVTPSDSLNDVRVDLVHDYAYLTDIANEGSLVVLNLNTGQSRQVLVGNRSTAADPGQHFIMPDGEIAKGGNGKPVVVHADGIALSPDASWVYYRPLTDHNYWRVPTSALIDSTLSPAALSKKVEFLGTGPMTGGLIMDRHGTLYGGDLEHASIVALTFDPSTHKLESRLFVRDKGNLSWADGFAIHDGYLYVSDSHLWEVSFKNSLPRSGPFTIFKVKLPNSNP